MNYAQARERKGLDGQGVGLWDWTVMNDHVVHRASPCNDSCNHSTKEDAERHWYNYSLEHVRELINEDEQHKCAVCGEWTNGALGLLQFSLFHFFKFLCDKHRTKEELVKLQPFEGGYQVIYS